MTGPNFQLVAKLGLFLLHASFVHFDPQITVETEDPHTLVILSPWTRHIESLSLRRCH